MDLTRTDGRYCTCDLYEKTPKGVLVSSDISCGVCECPDRLQRSHPLMSFYSERAMDLMPPGQESLMMIVDYKSTSLRTSPSISAARTVSERQMLELTDHAHTH